MRLIAILIAASLGGCATYIPVETAKLKVPAECKAGHRGDLPTAEPLTGPTASPDQVNRQWAAHHRLQSRPQYRRLYRDFKVCSQYARGV